MSKHGTHVVETLASVVCQIVFNGSPSYPWRILGAQGQRLTIEFDFIGINLVFDNIRSVAILETDLATGTFCYDKAPRGYQVRIVTVSKTTDGKYWLGNIKTEIGTNATVDVAPQEVDEQQMLRFLKSL